MKITRKTFLALFAGAPLAAKAASKQDRYRGESKQNIAPNDKVKMITFYPCTIYAFGHVVALNDSVTYYSEDGIRYFPL